MKEQKDKKHYGARFRMFMRDMTSINRMKPRERFLYHIMDGVPFQDLEVSIQMAKMDFKNVVNDEENKG